MATNSNMGFHQQGTLVPAPAAFNSHAISFHSGATSSSAAGILSPDSSGGFGDVFCTLRREPSLAMEWSPEEQVVLEEGLIKYADETNIMKYIKIAADLRDKTVRDVAFRCHWMTRKESGKRRKPEDPYAGKKLKDRKEKVVDSSTRTNICPLPNSNLATYPFPVYQMDNNNALSCQATTSTVTSTTRHLLDENVQVFNQIAANMEAYKVQDNIDLFCRTRSNIAAILDDMSGTPGIMSRMPPLQVSIDEELASTILPNTTQESLYCNPAIHIKQELMR
ncbi:uncharacterized protein LOC116261139 isoform X2 [Nymphaea colorata]|uniref:uncharacterized protein LOC116261139 isoform X2 n=1 Tax=Nymphaea colorata TaxID=210225 RepID=UPI00129DAAB4|nr:uncharacterized protein LOC116261139 isoform X2 [Nymphaea colorata]